LKLGIMCVYNNNPYALRDEETAEFRKQLKMAGIKEVAYATYPPMGQESAGYTYAMLLLTDDRDQYFTIWDILRAVTMESFEEMNAALPMQVPLTVCEPLSQRQ
jgi:hypothetical protein